MACASGGGGDPDSSGSTPHLPALVLCTSTTQSHSKSFVTHTSSQPENHRLRVFAKIFRNQKINLLSDKCMSYIQERETSAKKHNRLCNRLSFLVIFINQSLTFYKLTYFNFHTSGWHCRYISKWYNFFKKFLKD